jgi:hypothetical protein
VANLWLWQALEGKRPKDHLIDCSPAHLRHLFHTIVEHLNIPGHFSLYSF